MNDQRSGRALFAIALAISVIGVSQLDRTPAAAAGLPVLRSVQQAFHAGSLTDPSAPVEDFAGEPLTLQAIDVGMTASEPTIGVHADGTAFFAAATLAVDTDVAWGVAQTHVLRSTDGGITWEEVGLRFNRTNTPIPAGNLDPMIWLDEDTGRLFDVSLLGACSWMNISDTKGASWVPNPLGCGTQGFNDHQTIGGGPPPAGIETLGYPNVLYYCVNELIRSQCGRSLDGGVAWLPTETDPYPVDDLTCGKLVGHVEADGDGRVFLPNGGCDNPWIAISEDAGATWTRVNVSPAIESVLTHTAVAIDDAGNVYYMTLGRIRDEDPRGTRYVPLLSISRDHGLTWSDPLMVAPPGVYNANFPEIAAGDEGKIAITFPGTEQRFVHGGTAKNSPWNQYVVVTEDALAADPVFLSATANDPAHPVHRGECLGRCGGWWDFIDIVISADGEAWASGADDCIFRCESPGDLTAMHAGRGIAIRQIGGPKLRGTS